MSARIHSFAWLADGIAILIGSADKDGLWAGEVLLDGEPLKSRPLMYATADGTTALITLAVPRRPAAGESLGRLSLLAAGREVAVEPADVGSVAVDLQTLVRTSFAPLDAEARNSIVAFLAATPVYPGTTSERLTRGLVAVREALRERLAQCVIGRDEPIGLALECVLAIDESTFFIQGWLRDAEARTTSLRVVAPEGASVEILDRIYRFRRTDLEGLYGVPPGDPAAGTGFACCIELPAPSTAMRGWLVELRNAAGSAVEAGAPAVVSRRDEVRSWLLSSVDLERPAEDVFSREHLLPALGALQQRNAERLAIDRAVQFGEPPRNPIVSIVIPLYRRIDFLEHQLAQFSLDPDLQASDLIYVLDSPELSRDLMARAAALVELYRVPFRVVSLRQNVGFAGANMAGTSLAWGRLVMFMNSDVLPEAPGWLSAMVAFYDSKPAIGGLAPKLLFEDDTIQHAGLFFRRPKNAMFWENEHYFKGQHRDVAPANRSRVVPGVTAACMLIDRELLIEVGGFNGSYVRGDYEDSDLCLRLIKSGRENWYQSDVALYHLEGQSYEIGLRVQGWRYNGWLHTLLWGDLIERVMHDFGDRSESRSGRSTAVAGLVALDAVPTNGSLTEELEVR